MARHVAVKGVCSRAMMPTRPTHERPARASLVVLLSSVMLLGALRSSADDEPSPSPRPPASPTPSDPSDAFFGEGRIPTLTLELAKEDAARLKAEPREYVACRLREGVETSYDGVAVKLKGGAGSFRALDDKPAFTVNVDKFCAGARFHGLAKFHLDNSVQDDTYLDEALCAELFTAAGLPAPRVTHARVSLDGRDLGLYVLKEGVDKRFLARHFTKSKGNLYDGGFCADVDTELEKDAGKGPDDRSDLKALVAACLEPDLLVRAKRLPEVLDVDRFLSFTALERMACHWDGYSQNRNNYRIYFDPTGGRAVFLAHGMDQMFQDPEASVLDEPVAIVAASVLEVPAWRRLYRERLVALLPLFDPKGSLLPRVRRIAERLKPVLLAMGAEAAAAHADRVRELEERLVARDANLREQVKREDPPALEFDKKGRASVVGWRAVIEDGEPSLEQADHAGRRALGIVVGKDGKCVASWRRGVVLTRGRYVLEANVAAKGVTPRLDTEGAGAGLRVSRAVRKGGVSGSATWKLESYEFEVSDVLVHVELVAELRATKGQAWFELGSFRLVRKGP